MPKAKKEKELRNPPLAEQILHGDWARGSGRPKVRGKEQQQEEEYVDERLSRKILSQARLQQEELQLEFGLAKRSEAKAPPTTVLGESNPPPSKKTPKCAAVGLQSPGLLCTGLESHFAVLYTKSRLLPAFYCTAPLGKPLYSHCRRTLADIVMEKITEKQTEVESMMSQVSGRPMPQLDPRVLEVYKGVKEV
nr:PREDICTED: bystin [Latimeria chalumnae]|eukprot:XP_014341416.1 PREDICTED: bystin [Latimeria chalumnae]